MFFLLLIQFQDFRLPHNREMINNLDREFSPHLSVPYFVAFAQYQVIFFILVTININML